MEKKKGTVIRSNFIEEYKPKDKKTIYYVHGVVIKFGNNPKTDVDAGLYYSPEKDQKEFMPAQEVEYSIKIDDKHPNDPKKSRIKPWKEEKAKSSPSNKFESLSIEDYTARKIVDTASFTASYVCKALEGEKPEDMIKMFPQIANVVYAWQIEKIKKGVE